MDTAELEGYLESYKRFRRSVVANAGRLCQVRPRWAHVMDATGHGSTVARALCVDAGFDPDEEVGIKQEPPAHCGEEYCKKHIGKGCCDCDCDDCMEAEEHGVFAHPGAE